MKDLSIYFTQSEPTRFQGNQIGSHLSKIETEYSEIEKGSIVLFSVPEYRGSKKSSVDESIRGIIDAFLELETGINWYNKIYDLGEIRPGSTLQDTYFALTNVVEELIKHQVVPIVIGGSQDLFVAVHNGYKYSEQLINTCLIDYKFDLGEPAEEFDNESFIGHLLIQRPCILFNHAVIGLQAPYTSKTETDLCEKLHFDNIRLGDLVTDIRKAEPILRFSDVVSIDVRSIKGSETQLMDSLPNGFNGQQICQLAWYAGISDKLTCFGLYNIFELNKISMKLYAEVIWYFIEGIANRKGDFPVGTKRDYTKFTVLQENGQREVVFYKSNKSDRWWLEVPYPPTSNSIYDRHTLIPCGKEDYDLAANNILPDLWWRTYHKLF